MKQLTRTNLTQEHPEFGPNRLHLRIGDERTEARTAPWLAEGIELYDDEPLTTRDLIDILLEETGRVDHGQRAKEREQGGAKTYTVKVERDGEEGLVELPDDDSDALAFVQNGDLLRIETTSPAGG